MRAGHSITFLVYPADGGPVEEIGTWPMAFLPGLGNLVTLTHAGGTSAWVVQQVTHHVGDAKHQDQPFHAVDIVVAPAEDVGVRAPR